MTDTPIEAQVVSEAEHQRRIDLCHESALAVRPAQEVGLFGTQDPAAIIDRARVVAKALKDVIVKQGLVSRIQGKEYAKCEAWTLLGTMLGVFPVLVWSKPVEGGWEARVEARTKDGSIIGAAEAQCLRAERNWSNRDDFTLRSMAQTRATAKCLRMPLGFVMSLSGFEVTPAEEMVSDHPHKPNKDAWVCTDCGQTNSGWAKECGRCEKSKPAPAAQRPAPSKEPQKPKPPTLAYRKTMIERLEENGLYRSATDYFQKLTDPTPLMPGEALGNIRLPFVPNSQDEMDDLIDKIQHFANGDPAAWAFKPHWDAEGDTAKPAAASLPKPGDPNPEAWRSAVVHIPRKGMRLAEYIEHPDTLGSLWDLRHGNDDESAYARQRLFGLVEHHSEPTGWTKKDGTKIPPTQDDFELAKWLKEFSKWFSETHRGERL